MTKMVNHGSGRVRLEFRIPARGLIGFRSQFLTDTKGTGIMNHIFASWEPWHGAIPARATGALVADRAGVATAYAIFNLQERGEIFIDPAIAGLRGHDHRRELARRTTWTSTSPRKRSRPTCARRRPTRRSASIPPRKLGLEQAIEFINDDELVEVTPTSIRLRKRILAANMRPKARESRARAQGCEARCIVYEPAAHRRLRSDRGLRPDRRRPDRRAGRARRRHRLAVPAELRLAERLRRHPRRRTRRQLRAAAGDSVRVVAPLPAAHQRARNHVHHRARRRSASSTR